MNYNEIYHLASSGIEFFSDDDGEFVLVVPGSVSIVDGVEVVQPEARATINGCIREFKSRDIDGEMILAGDKRGIFNADVPIRKGMRVIVDGEAYNVVDPRAIKPTGTVIAYRPVLRRISVHG